MACYEYKGVKYTEEDLVKLLQSQQPKTRRILELQSDLFQKGRDKEDLTNLRKIESIYDSDKYTGQLENGEITEEEYINILEGKDINRTQQNQFLQILNKDNNWVTFFIKSIIQDSAKKGYEKVLFPTGNTASKVEGHTTLEEFKKEKEYRINILKEELKILNNAKYNKENSIFDSLEKFKDYNKKRREAVNNEIVALKQELERVETEGFGALKPIFNFYEKTVTNILNKQGYNPTLVTDEYGNTWNEITLDNSMLENILLSKSQDDFIQPIKPGVAELFESNFLIFVESKTSDEVINKLLSNKIIDKKCN